MHCTTPNVGLMAQKAEEELGSYYHVDRAKTDEIMRPSPAFPAAMTEF